MPALRHIDYRPASAAEREALAPRLEDPWLAEAFESRAVGHAVQHLVPRELDEVRAQRLHLIDKIEREVQARLKREMNYWDHRAQVLKDQERAGKQPRMNPARARARADELADRMQRRMAELAKERDISAMPRGCASIEDPPKVRPRSAWAMRDLAAGLPGGFRRALPTFGAWSSPRHWPLHGPLRSGRYHGRPPLRASLRRSLPPWHRPSWRAAA